MTDAEFHASLKTGTTPAELSPPLLALWHDGRGDWDRAHAAVQDDASPSGAWVHAYLHRKEGDISNARYWYRRANQPESRVALDAEWTAIVRALVDADDPGE
jgi:hypothetical protein